MNIKELVKYLDITAQAKLVPFIQGSPGIGKSDVVRTIANKYKLKMIDVRLSQCDPTDLNGLPKLDGDRATFLPFDTFPLEDTPLDKGYNGWLIFLDEINSASKSVQAAAYKLILDRMVGQHKLHKNVVIMCAGNKETDNAIVNPISTALRSRFITLPLEPDADIWLDWAHANGIDWRVTAYIHYKKLDGLYDFDPEESDNVYACPRSWAMLSKLLKFIPKGKEEEYQNLIQGTIGNQAILFAEFCNYSNNIPKIEDIINGVTVDASPYNIGQRYLIASTLISNANLITSEAKAKNVINFLDELGKEYSVPFYLSVNRINKEILKYNVISSKMREFAVWLN